MYIYIIEQFIVERFLRVWGVYLSEEVARESFSDCVGLMPGLNWRLLKQKARANDYRELNKEVVSEPEDILEEHIGVSKNTLASKNRAVFRKLNPIVNSLGQEWIKKGYLN